MRKIIDLQFPVTFLLIGVFRQMTPPPPIRKLSMPGRWRIHRILSAAILASAAGDNNIVKVPQDADLLHHAWSTNEWQSFWAFGSSH